MSKTKLETKELKDEFRNKLATERKIKELKEEFRKFTKSKVGEMYRILSAIVKLKQLTNKRYRLRSLEREKGIDLSSQQIRYISSFQYMSSYSKNLVEKGIIKDSAVCFLIHRWGILQQPQWQNKAIKMFVEGKLTISQTAEMKQKDFLSFLNGKYKFSTDEKYLISATKTLRSMLFRIRQRGKIISNSKYKEGLLRELERLRKEIK